MTQIHVIHENAAWLEPLAAALERQALAWRNWFLDRGVFDLSRPPPEGVFYNRMSASSHANTPLSKKPASAPPRPSLSPARS